MTPEFPPLEAPADPGMREGCAPSLLGWDMAGGKRRQQLQGRKRQNYPQWRKRLAKSHPGAKQRRQGWNGLELGGLAHVTPVPLCSREQFPFPEEWLRPRRGWFTAECDVP